MKNLRDSAGDVMDLNISEVEELVSSFNSSIDTFEAAKRDELFTPEAIESIENFIAKVKECTQTYLSVYEKKIISYQAEDSTDSLEKFRDILPEPKLFAEMLVAASLLVAGYVESSYAHSLSGE